MSCQQCPICPDDILLALRRVPLGGKGCPSGGDPLPAEDVPPCLPFPHLPFPGIFRKCRLGVRGVCKEGPCLAATPRSISLPPCPTPLRLSEWDIGLGCVWRHLSEPCAGRLETSKKCPAHPRKKKKLLVGGKGKFTVPSLVPEGGRRVARPGRPGPAEGVPHFPLRLSSAAFKSRGAEGQSPRTALVAAAPRSIYRSARRASAPLERT